MLLTGSYSAAWTLNGFQYNDVATIPEGTTYVVHTVPASKTFTMMNASFLVQGWGDGGYLEVVISGNDGSGAFAGGSMSFVTPIVGVMTPVQLTTNADCYATAGQNLVIDSIVSPRSFSYAISGTES